MAFMDMTPHQESKIKYIITDRLEKNQSNTSPSTAADLAGLCQVLRTWKILWKMLTFLHFNQALTLSQINNQNRLAVTSTFTWCSILIWAELAKPIKLIVNDSAPNMDGAGKKLQILKHTYTCHTCSNWQQQKFYKAVFAIFCWQKKLTL